MLIMKKNKISGIFQVLVFVLLVASLVFLIIARKTAPTDGEVPFWVRQFRNLSVMNVAFLLWSLIGMVMPLKFSKNKVRIVRSVFMALSIALLGFIFGPCLCVVGYVQNTVLYCMGNAFFLPSLLITLVFMMMAYIYGKYWCGWLCPLGALQEFPYLGNFKKIRNSRFFRFFQTRTAIAVMRTIQAVAFVALIVLVVIRKVPFICRFDPFKAVYMLPNIGVQLWTVLTWVLVSVLIVTSLLIYRPFCQMFCPMGMLMDLALLIPGSRRLRIKKDSCVSCGRCEKCCKMHAIRDKQIHTTCIYCGNCLATKCKHMVY